MISNRYIEFLERFGDYLVPLRDYAFAVDPKRTTKYHLLGLRHDVDKRPDIAVKMARVESDRGVYATYCLLHTADYWKDQSTNDFIRRLVDLGHEVAFHNDLLSVLCRNRELPGVPSVAATLEEFLARCSYCGADITGTSSHGAKLAREHRFLNYYVWREWTRRYESHPCFDFIDFDDGKSIPIPKLKMADYGLDYEAYALSDYDGNDYYSDTHGGFNPDVVAAKMMEHGQIQVLVHPNKRTPAKDGERKFLWVT